MSDYYQILGVSRFASEGDLRKAFRLKAKSLHPDVNSSGYAVREFKRVNEAYQVLRNAEKRRLYDMRLNNGAGGRFRAGKASREEGGGSRSRNS